MELVRSFCSINGGPPTKRGGRAPALIVSRTAQRSLYVTACMLAKSPKRPSTPEAPTASFPPPPLRLLPGGANPVPGVGIEPRRAHFVMKDKVTFPRAPLQSRKVGFPDSGFRLGYPREAFPRCLKLKRSLAYTPAPIPVYLPARP